MKPKMKKYRVVRKSKNEKSNSIKLRTEEMNQSLIAQSFLEDFKKAFPNRSVAASNENEAYNAISEQIKLSPEKIRALIEGPLRKNFIHENLCCPEDPSNPVFVEIVYCFAKSPKSQKSKINAKSNVQNSNNKTETQLEKPLKSFSFLEIIDGPCCNNIPIKQPIASLKEGVRIVLCICPIHRKAWREGTG